jgi:Tol biopolymer transport system component
MARDLLLELKWIAEAGSQAGVPVPLVPRRTLRTRLAWSAVVVLALVALVFAVGLVRRTSKPPQSARLIADIGADASLYTTSGTAAILSPDGSQLAFVAAGSDLKRQIYVRPLDQLQATALSGTENADNLFFSADGQWLGFFADGKLKKILVRGGAAVTLCDAHDDRGGSWGEDGTIVFTPYVGAPLTKISSAGGTPQSLTSLDAQAGELTHRWPQVLPGGSAVLFTSSTSVGYYEDADIVVYSMSSGQRKTVQRGGFHARYVSSGHLIYMHKGTLFAVPFDLKRLETTGPAVPILDNIVTNPLTGGAQFSLSDTGNLLYVTGPSIVQNFSIYWMDREGKFTPLREPAGDYLFPTFSPEGKRLALQIRDSSRSDIWVYQWERDLLTRITFESQSNSNPASSPIWTPDGQRITYSSPEKDGAYDLYWTRADGAGDALRLTTNRKQKRANSWSPDGKTLAFMQLNGDTSWDIMMLSVEGDAKVGWKLGEPKPFLNGSFIEQDATFSPDGRWLAYASNESGSLEVYVQPFPGPGGRWQISTGGGSFPRWSRSSRELFYRATDQRIMVATYDPAGGSFGAGKAAALVAEPIRQPGTDFKL